VAWEKYPGYGYNAEYEGLNEATVGLPPTAIVGGGGGDPLPLLVRPEMGYLQPSPKASVTGFTRKQGHGCSSQTKRLWVGGGAGSFIRAFPSSCLRYSRASSESREVLA
jgi:hypothetical protein